MATYYCDLGNATFADATGADNSGNEYTGPAGLQAAIRGTGNATALAAGDEIQWKGTGDEGRLVLLDCAGSDVSAWAPLDVVRNLDGAGDDWTGVVVQANDDPAGQLGADDLVLVWMDTGKSAADVDVADGVENTTAVDNVDPITSATTPGIYLDTAQGTAGALIELIGVNSSWVDDGTYATLDGDSKAAVGLFNVSEDYIGLKNIEIKNAVDGIDNSAVYYRGWILNNCSFHDNSNDGISGINTTQQMRDSSLYRCKFYNNGRYGFLYLARCSFEGCLIYNNAGAYGGYPYLGSAFKDCIFYDNTGFALNLVDYAYQLTNCTFDNNGNDGLRFAMGTSTIVGCRITNNKGFAFFGSAASTVFEAHNFIYGNSSGVSSVVVLDTVDQLTTGNVGYKDVIYTFDFDTGSGTPYVVGEAITGGTGGGVAIIKTITDNAATGTITYRQQAGKRFIDNEVITGGTGGKTAALNGEPATSGTPDYRLVMGGAGYRSEVDLDGTNKAVFNRGLSTVPIVRN